MNRSPASQLTRTVFTYLTLLLITLYAIYTLGTRAAPWHSAGMPWDTAFLQPLGKSSLVALAVAMTGLALASAAGYILSRSGFLRRGSTFGGALLAQLLPPALLIAVLCLGLVWLGLFASYLALLIVYLVTTLPFCIWQMKRNYDTIPLSFEQAAEIDGASAWQSFSRILLPLGAPALVVTGLFSLFAAWNESVIGAILVRNPSTSALPDLAHGFQFAPALPSTAAPLVSIPAILVFVVLSRFLIASVHSGVARN